MGGRDMLLEQFLRPHRVFIGVGVLVALGVGYSVYSRAADPPQDDAGSRNRIHAESVDVGRAIGRLNQSYAISPVISAHAFTGGSYFIDTQDGGDGNGGIALNQGRLDDASASDAPAGGHANKIKLPPPLFIGGLCGSGCQLPCWLQGDIGWMYGESPGPVCVDIPRPVIVPRPGCGCPCQGHHPSPGCGCSCHGHHPHPHPCPHVPSHGMPQAETPIESDAILPPAPEAVPPAPGDIQPRTPRPATPAPAPHLEPAMPSVLKPAVPSKEQMLQEELRRLREEVEQLRDQLNLQRQASLLDLEA
jgi:hypothetical protein